MSLLRNEFDKRFRNILKIISFPFNDETNVEEISIKLKEFLDVDQILVENEILDPKRDLFLKSRAASQN